MTDVSMDPQEPDAGEWFGHPKGLFYLFFAEMWERFCFYGMRNILVLYMVHYFLFEKGDAQAGPYAAYTALIYCVAIFGGYIADKYIGYRTSIMLGGIQMAVGMIMLVLNRDIVGWMGFEMSKGLEEFFFYAGMATMIVGNGFFKPNISTIVGKLYKPGDPRRDGGFTIFYMGINVGALIGGIICAEVGARVSWTLGFGIAAAGMLLGVFTFGTDKCRNALMGHGEPKSEELRKRSLPIIIAISILLIPVFYYLLQNSWIVGWILGITAIVMVIMMLKIAYGEELIQRNRMLALLLLVGFNPVFWSLFEQAGSSLTLYADTHLNKSVFGWFTMSSGTVQNFNAFFIIALAPLFAAVWVKLAKKGKDPTVGTKFALGLLQLGLGFLVLVLGARFFTGSDGQTPLVFMIGLYFLLTTGELCLSPVGLSAVTKLAPQRLTGFVMGFWFLSIAGANFLAGQIGALTGGEKQAEAGEKIKAAIEAAKKLAKETGNAYVAPDIDHAADIANYTGVYMNSFYFVMGATVLLVALIPLIRKWTAGVK
jgi:proton-dependent oligopeptide transporter, POT family